MDTFPTFLFSFSPLNSFMASTCFSFTPKTKPFSPRTPSTDLTQRRRRRRNRFPSAFVRTRWKCSHFFRDVFFSLGEALELRSFVLLRDSLERNKERFFGAIFSPLSLSRFGKRGRNKTKRKPAMRYNTEKHHQPFQPEFNEHRDKYSDRFVKLSWKLKIWQSCFDKFGISKHSRRQCMHFPILQL